MLSSVTLDKTFLYKSTEVKPKLRHILRGKESGQLVEKVEVEGLIKSDSYLTEDHLMPTGRSVIKVLAPSVFFPI